jgi:hypothetical protein
VGDVVQVRVEDADRRSRAFERHVETAFVVVEFAEVVVATELARNAGALAPPWPKGGVQTPVKFSRCGVRNPLIVVTEFAS